MNVPVGSSLDFLLITSNPVSGAVVDILSGLTLVNPTITVRQGKDLIDVPTAAPNIELKVTKVTGTTGIYWVSLYLNPATFKPGRTYSIVASYAIGTTAVVREALLIRAMAAEPVAGYPGLNFTGLWDAIVDGTKTFRDCMIGLCSLAYGDQTVSRYNKVTNKKMKTMLRQDKTPLVDSTSTYVMEAGEGPDLIKVERTPPAS